MPDLQTNPMPLISRWSAARWRTARRTRRPYAGARLLTALLAGCLSLGLLSAEALAKGNEVPHAASTRGPRAMLRGPIHAFSWAAPPTEQAYIVPLLWIHLHSYRTSAQRAAAESRQRAPGTAVVFLRHIGDGLLTNPADRLIGPGGSRLANASPWPTQGIRAVRRRVRRYLEQYRRAGGRLDFLALDFERGLSVWQLGKNRQRTLAAIAHDPRFGKLARQLGFADLSPLLDRSSFHVSFRLDRAAIRRALKAPPKYLLWNRVMGRRVDAALEQAVIQPVLASFPHAGASNYSSFDLTADNPALDPNGQPIGPQSRIGTAGSPAFYGRIKQLAQRRLPDGSSYGRSAFAALRWHINSLRAIERSSRAPVVPWVCRADWRPSRLAFSRYYDELIDQLAVGGVRNLLFWNPPVARSAIERQQHGHIDRLVNQLLSMLLSEINQRLGNRRRRPLSLEPLAWNTPVIATAMRLGRGPVLWRITVAPGIKAVRIKSTGKILRLDDGPGRWYTSRRTHLQFEPIRSGP